MDSGITHVRPAMKNLWRGEMRKVAVAVMLIVIAGGFLRFRPIGAVLPYSDYIDEGYVLNQAIDHLNNRSYDSHSYNYPPLPSYLVTAAMITTGPVYRLIHHHGFRRDLPKERDRYTAAGGNYNLIAPPELIFVGRAVVALLSVATLALVGVIAWRLAGANAAFIATLFCAFCPALVIRGSTIIVDSFATFFALASIYFAERLRTSTEPRASMRFAALAGVAAGLAAASKYTIASVIAATIVIIITLKVPAARKLKLLAISAAGSVVAGVCAIPVLVLQPAKLLHELRLLRETYYSVTSPHGYWVTALFPWEMGLPLVLASLAGVALMFARRDTRVSAASWIAFGCLLIIPLLPYPQRPFRNLLPLVPLACIAAGVLFSSPADWFPRHRRAARAAQFLGVALAIVIALPGARLSRHWIYDRLSRVDSRVQAVDWLRGNTRPDERILAISELVILPAEWKRLSARVREVSWTAAMQVLATEHFDYIVSGEMELFGTKDLVPYDQSWNDSMSPLPIAASFGTARTPIYAHHWRLTDQRIFIRKPPPGWVLRAE